MSMSENPGTRERLVMAAIRLFARDGYKSTTVRAICKQAQTANATAVSYYFGGKQKLYKAILEMIFAENMRRRQQKVEQGQDRSLSPEERLRQFLDTMVEVGFCDEPMIDDIVTIVKREMTMPTGYMDEAIEAFTRADNEELTDIIRDILGPDAPDYLVRDCLASVGGQIFYYMAFWPVFSRIYPEHPGIGAYRTPLVEHVMRFSMAGLKETRAALEKGLIPREEPRKQSG